MKIASNAGVAQPPSSSAASRAPSNRLASNAKSSFDSTVAKAQPVALGPAAQTISPPVVPTGPRVPADGTYPTVDEVNQIAAMTDPVQRNYKITQAYSDLSGAMSDLVGPDANWSTFAVWASKQVGVSIRQEDVPDLEKAIQAAAGPANAIEKVNGILKTLGVPLLPTVDDLISGSSQTLNLMSQQLGQGNQEVFAQVAPQFARFIQTFKGDTHYDQAKVDQFLAGFPPDEPQLKTAFASYAKAMFEPNPTQKSQEMLYGNDMIGMYEQSRLQPQIAGALNAPDGMFKTLINDSISNAINTLPFPANDLAKLAIQKSGILNGAVGDVATALDGAYRDAATKAMMKLGLPDQTLHVGNDLPTPAGQSQPYPSDLTNLTYPPLVNLVSQIDHHPGTLTGSGAKDWSSLSDRMQYIGNLFRSTQHDPSLFDPPFGKPGSYPLPPSAVA